MSMLDVWPMVFDDEEDADWDQWGPKTCRRCGASNLFWVRTGKRWALADGKGLHQCSSAASASEFENLE